MRSHRSYITSCLRKELIAPSIYELQCQKPADFTFQSGQFVLVDVPLQQNTNDIQPRAYSIASAPFEHDMRFIIKLVQNGRASTWIEHDLEVGMPIRMQGPFGNFQLDTASSTPCLFLATGTGIAPLRSHILSALKERRNTRPLHLLFGVLTREDSFWEDEWRALEQQHSHFHAHFSFLSGEADWHGETGALHERLPRLLREVPDPIVYICGAPATVQELQEQCRTLGIPKASIRFERYI